MYKGIHIVQLMVHIGIIPDGNRRWYRKNNNEMTALHHVWMNFALHIMDTILNMGATKYKHLSDICEISIYICSIDNLNRTDGTNSIIYNFVRRLWNEMKPSLDNNPNIRSLLNQTKINVVGDIEILPMDIKLILQPLLVEKENPLYIVNLALAYDYNKDMINYGVGNIESYNRDQSNIDMVFRCGGEKRTSGFFPTKTIYSEWVFNDKLWPEVTLCDIDDAIKDYKQRKRRFGK